jgi:DNA-binding NtrC family response regulator
MAANILIIDDEANLTFFLKKGLEGKGYEVSVAGNLRDGKRQLDELQPDLLLLDQNLPDGNGLVFFKELQSNETAVPTVMITAHGSIGSAIEAIRSVMDEYIVKPFDLEQLTVVIESMLERYRLKNQLNYYRRQVQDNQDFIYFESSLPRLNEIQQTALKIAEVPVSSVLIEGDTGTGKEMLARYIHNHSPQAEKPFVEINCASLPETLLESELFGYEPGAFTDAKKKKVGLIELAQGGTLFLDEIGEMKPQTQAKLLRFLENHSFKRLGGVRDIKVELRVIAATNRDIEKLVGEGAFRKDLFYRLNIFRLQLPRLAERKGEILLLAQFFLEKLTRRMNRKIKTISQDCQKVILQYDWPGNLRELHNVLERAVILCNKDMIEVEYLPKEICQTNGTGGDRQPSVGDLGSASLKTYMEQIERRIVLQALEQTGWNQLKTADLLNEPRHIIRYLIRKHDLKPPPGE